MTSKNLIHVPNGCEVVNVTDFFSEGGALVVSYVKRTNSQERENNRKKIDTAVGYVLESVLSRGKTPG